MRLHEVVNRAVGSVNRSLLTEPSDMRASISRIRKVYGSGQQSSSALLQPRNGRQQIIAATVEPYDVTLVHPNRAGAKDIFIRSHKKFSDLRFREDGGWEIRPLDLCIGLHDRDTWFRTAYVIAKDTVFAVLPPERQTIDFDSTGPSANVVYVFKAYPNESLAVVRTAQQAVRSYRASQREYKQITEANSNA